MVRRHDRARHRPRAECFLSSLPGFTELAHDVAAASRYFDEDVTNPMVDITDRCTIIVPDEENGIHYDVDEKQIDKMEAGHWIFK